MSRTIEVFEHDTLHVSESKDGITQSEFDALVRFNDVQRGRFFEVGHRRITLNSFVGYLEVGKLSIEVLPKADRGSTLSTKVWRDGLLEMLRVAFGLRLEHPSAASQQLARFRLLDLVALGYLAEIEPLMHQGLAKGYRNVETNGAVFRGRLKMSGHIRENAARADRFFVEHQTYDQDISLNRLLAAALHALDWCALSPHAAGQVEACLGRFPEVQTAGVTSALLDRIRLTRTTERYSASLVYVRMILAHQGPQLQSGRERVFALLFDMNMLWERYVAALFRRISTSNIVVNTQEHHLFWRPRSSVNRTVRPDVVVRAESHDGSGKTLLVIDTKWKVPRKGTPSDDDLKQMFVYNELLNGGRAILLYPGTDRSVPMTGTYAQRTHSCEQFYLGLSDVQGWSTKAMTSQLASLLETTKERDPDQLEP